MTVDEQKKFVDMQEDLSAVRGDVKEIKAALLGDGYVSHGLIGELNVVKDKAVEQERRIVRLETLLIRATWMSLGIGIGAGAGLTQVVDWLLKMK